MSTIIVKWVEDDGMYGKEMRVVESDHERFSKGTRFDFGFFNIATGQGYTIISLPVDEKPTIKTVCMECKSVIIDGPDGPLSHGICMECIPDFLKRGGVSDEKIKKHMENITNGN